MSDLVSTSTAELRARRALGRTLFVSLAALGLAASGCAASSSTGTGGSGEGGQASGKGGGGGSEAATTSSKGGGGEAGGATTTGTGTSNACGVDCSTAFSGLQQCQQGVCNETTGKCDIGPAVDKPCDDTLYCTVGEKCDAQAQCVGGTPNPCSDLKAEGCVAVVCREDAGKCLYQQLDDGTACDATANPCETNGVCKGGTCKGQPKDCFFSPVPNDCHAAACNPTTGVCEPKPKADGQECVSSDLCVTSGLCAAGECTGGTPKSCSSKDDDCVKGTCDPATGVCKAVPIPAGGSCPLAGGTDCNVGECDATGTCTAKAIAAGQPCNDKKACTLADKCDAGGTCSGTVASGTTTLFEDDFSDNSAGWTFSPAQASNEWAIGPAKKSTPHSHFSYDDAGDPALDNTSTADNGIAGVVIGGDAKISTKHPLYYIVSPVLDASGITGGLTLEYARWLNADDSPTYMYETVEVYDGAAWVKVWDSGADAWDDSSWVPMEHDITAFKSNKLQVRFGYEIRSTAAYLSSCWNLDDVVIRSCQ